MDHLVLLGDGRKDVSLTSPSLRVFSTERAINLLLSSTLPICLKVIGQT